MRTLSVLICLMIMALAARAAAQEPVLRALPIDGACPEPLPEAGTRRVPIQGDQDQPDWEWLPQEKWAWNRICLGETADLSQFDRSVPGCHPVTIEQNGQTVPDGRVLRPEFLRLIVNTPPWSGLPARPHLHLRCAEFRETVDLSNQFIASEVSIDQSRFQGGLNLRSARFQRSVLVNRSEIGGVLLAEGAQVQGDVRFRDGVVIRSVRMDRAVIRGDLNVDGIEVSGPVCARRSEIGGAVTIRRSVFHQPLIVEDSAVQGDYTVSGSTLHDQFAGSEMHVGGSMLFDTTSFAGTPATGDADTGLAVSPLDLCSGETLAGKPAHVQHLVLNGAAIAGDLDLRSVDLANGLNARTASVGGHVKLNAVEVPSGALDFSETQIDGGLSIVETEQAGGEDESGKLDILASGAAIGGDVVINTVDADSVWLRDARIGGSVRGSATVLTGSFDLWRTDIAEGLNLSGVTLADGMTAGRLRLAGDLTIGGIVSGRSSFEGARIGGDVNLMGGPLEDKAEGWSVSLNATRIGGDLLNDAAEQTGGLTLVDLSLSKAVISGDAHLSRARIATLNGSDATIGGTLSLYGAELDDVNLTAARIGQLALNRSEIETRTPGPVWSEGASFQLNGAQTGVLDAQLGSWKRNGEWIASNLRGFDYGALKRLGTGQAGTLAREDTDALVEWLLGVERARSGAPDGEQAALPYMPERFDRLAVALEAAGATEKAHEIGYEKYVHRSQAAPGPESFWERQILWPLHGWLMGYGYYPHWFLWPLVGGIAVGWIIAGVSASTELRGSGSRSLFYSVDTALPLIELNAAHGKMELGHAWMRSYFIGLKILGYVVAAALTGTLTFL